jgi:hypothetical protein
MTLKEGCAPVLLTRPAGRVDGLLPARGAFLAYSLQLTSGSHYLLEKTASVLIASIDKRKKGR